MKNNRFFPCSAYLITSVIFLLFTLSSFVHAQFSPPEDAGTGEVTITGELKKWHAVTLSFEGPFYTEMSTNPSPFVDYQLVVTFTNGDNTVRVPGYFAADGNAAESSAFYGNSWQAKFCPSAEGVWDFSVSYRIGSETGASMNTWEGTPVPPLDGITGSFSIDPSDKKGRDFRGKGMLNYVGEHYMRFAETGEYFIKGGIDSPENLLGYRDFDGTYDRHGHVSHYLHHYIPHIRDWKVGDPTWQDGKGKGLIGAVNYVSNIGLNSMYFLTQNANGDGDDTWPWVSHDDTDAFDCSKLAQWDMVFSHMQQKGVMMHLVQQEQENDQYLNGGELGLERKLYYKELIARFAHHPALVWNMGEENTNTGEQRAAFAEYIRSVDPYDHPIVVHTYPGDLEKVYADLLNNPHFEGTSFQINSRGNLKAHDILVDWYHRSEEAGKNWLINFDEIHPASFGLKPDHEVENRDSRRKYDLWAAYMAGACGMEWYCGSEAAVQAKAKATSNRDRTLENLRTRESMWVQTRIARKFFQSLPVQHMKPHDELVSGGLCFADPGKVYVVYLLDGGSAKLDLGSYSGIYTVQWLDTREGGELQQGTVQKISGDGRQKLGDPPADPEQDWVVLVRLGQ